MRYPGVMLGSGEVPFPPLLRRVASQLKVSTNRRNDCAHRDQTQREHIAKLQTIFGFKPFTEHHYRQAVYSLDDLAAQTDKGIVLATALVHELRDQFILLPSVNVIERICAEAVTRGNRRLYRILTEPLSHVHSRALDNLLKLRPSGKITFLAWLRQSPSAPNPKQMLEHTDRLRALQALDLPDGIEKQVHQNRLLKMAREGSTCSPGHS
jgi:hypothetical protein